MKRVGISKRARFEVFKRDGFKCQYCGKCAPEVVLNVDHIEPVSKGGKSDLLNLITACLDCNAGKSDVALNDDAAIKKQKAQLDELNVKREQLEMMLKWRSGLEAIVNKTVDAVAAAWNRAAPGWHLNETGLQGARKYLKKYGADSVLNAIEVARTSYVKLQDEKGTKESVELAWHKVGGILRMNALPEWKRDLYYIRGILRNRLSFFRFDVVRDLERAVQAGIDTEYLKSLARDCRNWTQFETWLNEAIDEATANGEG